ncbi:hypothetical protein [Limnobacter sp.]|uniref:hypothetical protein n=1 Tax=Limnobacter sp. TaxID=2003368 RepID=UPI00311EDF21
MPTNIQTVEISGDYESINSFSAFKKLLRNLFTTPGPMFSFLEAKDISVNTFDSGYISGNRVYVSLTGGISYLFEIVGDIYTDITQVVIPPEEPPDEVVPSSGRLITKASPATTTVPLTAASNYVPTAPVESPNMEDETLSGLGIYSDRPALLSITQHAYSEELFELIKEYRMSKIQECKSKIDGLDPTIRAKLKKEYTEEIQKVNGLISFANDAIDTKKSIKDKKSELVDLESDIQDINSQLNGIQEQITEKNLELQSIDLQAPEQNNPNQTSVEEEENDSPQTAALKGLLYVSTIQSLKVWAGDEWYNTNRGRYVIEPDKNRSLLFYRNTIGRLTGMIKSIKADLKPFEDFSDEQNLDPTVVVPRFRYLLLALAHVKDNTHNTLRVNVQDTDTITIEELSEWYMNNKFDIFLDIEKLYTQIQDRIDNLQEIIDVLQSNVAFEEAIANSRNQKVSEIETLNIEKSELESELQDLEAQRDSVNEFVTSKEVYLSTLNLNNYSGVNEIFELSGFDFDRFTSFLSDQELITIQRQKQMYQANSAIGFLPRKELQIYNEAQWYLLKRYAEFLSKLDNPRLITFGIPSNAEEELGELIAAEIRIQPEDPIPSGKDIKFEGPIFLYNKDFFLVMKDDFSMQEVDEVFTNTTNFLSFRRKFRTRIAKFFTGYRITKNGIEEITVPSTDDEINNFRNSIIDFHDYYDKEPPLSTLSGDYKKAGKQILGYQPDASDIPFSQNALLVNHGIDFLTKELQRIYGGTIVDEDSFPLDDESQKFVISTTAITSIDSLSSDGFDSSVPLPETMSDPVLMSQLVSPQNSLRKICSDKVFSRTFSTFVDEQMFPVTTTLQILYDTQGTAFTRKWKRTAYGSGLSRWRSGTGKNNDKYVFYKSTNFTSNRRTGNMQIFIYHNGDTGIQ